MPKKKKTKKKSFKPENKAISEAPEEKDGLTDISESQSAADIDLPVLEDTEAEDQEDIENAVESLKDEESTPLEDMMPPEPAFTKCPCGGDSTCTRVFTCPNCGRIWCWFCRREQLDCPVCETVVS